MAFSQLNGIALCDWVGMNGLNRTATSSIIGQDQGVTCGKDPILSDGPTVSREVICTDILEREPSGDVKFVTNIGEAGNLGARSVLSTDGVCSVGTKLPVGWYVFFGENGPGYDGYQIVEMDGRSSCMPATITTC